MEVSLGMKKIRAFTLIELLIVVAVFSIIAAILVPNLIRARRQAQVAAQARSRASDVSATPTPRAEESGPLAEVRSQEMIVSLSARVERSGMEVATPYRADVSGSLKLGLPSHLTERQKVRVSIPFPLGASDATNVRLALRVGDTLVPESSLGFRKEGFSWVGEVSPDQEIRAEFHYEAVGLDRFYLALGPSSRVAQLKITLDCSQCPQISIPPQALQPTSRTPEKLEWDYQNLVAERALIVALPTDSTVDAKVLLLCRLVGLAVLLYGLGFWYLGELHQPGRLARFNWGNFFLLALTYSFFFPVLAVLSLGLNIDLPASLLIAGALSLPLLTIHVTRIVDFRFACANLGLAALTLGLVVNGVFGEKYQIHVYLAASFLCIGFVTLTFRRWSEHRQLWHRSREAELLALLEERQEEIRAGRQLAQQARSEGAGESEAVEAARKSLLDELRGADELFSEVRSLSALPWGSDRRARLGILKLRAEGQHRSLTHALQNLRLALQRREETAVVRKQGLVHCLVCGCGSEPSRCCPNCGQLRPLKLVCTCGEVLQWPVTHLKDSKMKPRCLGCGAQLEATPPGSDLAPIG